MMDSETAVRYDGFYSVEDPHQYLDAPRTISSHLSKHSPNANDAAGMYSLDMATNSYYDLSPMLNVQDPVALHFLVEKCIAESKGYKLLSYQELDEAKKESTVLHNRHEDMTNKLNMEYKLRDAASSLSKLHTEDSSNRRSFFNKDKKRLSKHAEEELDASSRKIHDLEQQVHELRERIYEIDTKIFKHSVGVLALTHQSSASSSAKAFEKHLKSNNRISSQQEGLPASNRMMRYSRNSSSSIRADEYELVDQMINSVHGCLGTSAGDISDHDLGRSKVVQLNDLVNTLVYRQSNNPSNPNREGDVGSESDYGDGNGNSSNGDENAHVKRLVQEVVYHLEPETKAIEFEDPEALRRQVFGALSRGEGLRQQQQQQQQQRSSAGGRSSADGKVKNLLQQQLDSVMQSYEQNRTELEKLELENVDLKTNLRDVTFKSQARVQDLENEAKTNQERIAEWRERCETLKAELESVVKSLEDLTRQTVEYESERQSLENKVTELQNQVYEQKQHSLNNRVSMMGTAMTTANGSFATPMTPKSEAGGDTSRALDDDDDDGFGAGEKEPTSVSILRHEFKRIITDMNSRHDKQLRKEQAEKKRLESLLRSIKTSSYAANLPPGKLESMGV